MSNVLRLAIVDLRGFHRANPLRTILMGMEHDLGGRPSVAVRVFRRRCGPDRTRTSRLDPRRIDIAIRPKGWFSSEPFRSERCLARFLAVVVSRPNDGPFDPCKPCGRRQGVPPSRSAIEDLLGAPARTASQCRRPRGRKEALGGSQVIAVAGAHRRRGAPPAWP